jgi:cupin 2 domain-containing protein
MRRTFRKGSRANVLAQPRRPAQPVSMSDDARPVPPTFNLLSPLPAGGPDEVVTNLLDSANARIERIVSRGQASPEGFWYEEDTAEWVLVLAGTAAVEIEGEAEERALGQGDCLFIPARRRHRVSWTDPDRPTVWLAVILA